MAAQPTKDCIGPKRTAIAAASEGSRLGDRGERSQGCYTADRRAEGVAEEVGRQADPGPPWKVECSVKTRRCAKLTG